MELISAEKVREILIKELAEFDKICKDNNLKYSVFYGTLLGAVRHKGFIPWDDDIDVAMPREDYDKLMAMQINNDNYEIKHYKYTDGYYYPFAKMIDKTTYIEEKDRNEKDMGLYIDIFPIDYVDNYGNGFDKEIRSALRAREFINHLTASTKKKYAKNALKFILKKIIHLFTDPFRIPFLTRFEQKHIKENGEYCINFVNNFDGESQLLKSEYWQRLIPMQFENISVTGFADYDAILTKKYGNYMELPKDADQISHHGFTAWYK